jgi:ubiquinone/menaquinone biosynthesis C-methylase UbiE
MIDQTAKKQNQASGFDHTSDPNFVSYYEESSLSPQTYARFRTVRDKLLKLAQTSGTSDAGKRRLKVLDIGCGAGTQCHLWAELGHDVLGLDVNEALIGLARKRVAEAQLNIRFDVGTATQLPFDDCSMDVCLLPELLEHVQDWETCLAEAVRVLKPGGLFYVSTTNALCPVQQEFTLPLYSWYPGRLKRRYEKLAVTTRPELVNHARYPAVHWFTFYQLSAFLVRRGFRCLDRFDMIDIDRLDAGSRTAVKLVRHLSPLRWLGHVLTPSTVVFAIKQ